MRLIETLRNPSYTGKNRCTPCTVLNLAIAIVLATLVTAWSLVGGIIVLTASALVIGLRGYLIPGTPALTKQYMPKSVLRVFGKTHNKETERRVNSDVSRNLEKILLSADVLEACGDQSDLCLTPKALSRWETEIDAYDCVTPRHVSNLAPSSSLEAEISIEDLTNGVIVESDGEQINHWPSRASMVTDLTGAAVLDDMISEWRSLSELERGHLLTGLRLFVPHCPTGHGDVAMTEETIESCCSSHEVVALVCDDGQRILEQPIH